MSRRGRGGRRQDEQSSPSPSFQRGRGDEGGRGGGGGRGRGEGGGRGGSGGRGRGDGGGRGRTGRGGGGGGGRGYGSAPTFTQAAAVPPSDSAFPSMSRQTGSSFPPLTPSHFAAPSPPIQAATLSKAQPSTQSVASSSGGPSLRAPASSSSVEELSRELSQELKLGDPVAIKQGTPPASSKAVSFPSRPGFGTVGRKCVVKANHFLVEIADRDLHHYDVTITPEVPSKKINRLVISQLVDMFRESHLGKRMLAYDGRKSLYTAGPLPFESKEFVVKLVDDPASDSKKREREFRVAIKFASKADIYHLRQFLHGRQMDAPQETIQALDIVLRAAPSKVYTTVGRSFFSPHFGQKGELGNGIESWRGFYQSLRPTQMGLSLNIDVSATSFYEPILVTEYVAKYFNLRDLSRPLSEQYRIKVKRSLRGVKVAPSHMKYAKSYKISGLSNQPLSQITFTDDRGTDVTVVNYFRQKYNIILKYTSLPALQAGSDSKPTYLPMELCKIVEGQRYTKRLNERQVTALLRQTCQRPPQRESSIGEMVRHNNYNRDELVSNEFGIQVNEEFTFVDARVLPPPLLKYHESGEESRVDPRNGQWNMIKKKMVNGGRVDFWACVNFSAHVNRDLPHEFCRQLIQMCVSKGMAFNEHPIVPIQSAHPSQIERVLTDVSKQTNQKGNQLQLLLIILPDFSGSYGTIKRVCETELGIVSQCCQPKQASKLNKQYLENVALKINVKVGGRNTVLNDAIQRRIPLVTDRPTIIFGADVTHPPPGEDSNPSIAAVVASMDWPEVTKYRGLVSAQTHRQEIIQDLYKSSQDPQRGLVHSGMIRELLIAFRRETNRKPERIIFYRDGVSEGQFSQVLLYEMDAIRKACNSLENEYLPPVTFVVVQKRHHTRFFPVDHRQTDRSGNILPGTVVDTKICHQREFDFYLNSHAGIQGTSRPAHYHVLFDENNFTADALQMLTNNLCYTYARCTKSVSIVPPAYYAHLLAFRARYYIEGETSDGASTSGRTATERSRDIRPLPMIKDNVKSVMFYC